MNENFESVTVVDSENSKQPKNKAWQFIKDQIAKIRKSTWKTIAAIALGIVILLFTWKDILMLIGLILLFKLLKHIPLWVWVVALWDRD